PVLARISSRSQTQARKVARELLKRADTIVEHAQTGTTPLELARVCKAWARVPAGIANARARSVAAPIANREQQKSTAEGRKCTQLFSEARAGGPKILRSGSPLSGAKWKSKPPGEIALDRMVVRTVGELARIGDADLGLRGELQIAARFDQRGVS